jgi:glycosyltransferase involved in cell wall biosynthesis
MYSSNVANVQVKHRERQAGKSNYRFRQIFNLVTEILFNYSSYPLRLVAGMGIIVAFFSFFLSLFYIMKAIFVGVDVPGWTTVVVLLSFFNGIALLILSMLGEYVVRSLTQTSQKEIYYIKEIIRG